MNNLYHLIEFLLLVCLILRIIYYVTCKSMSFHLGFIELLYYFVICFINYVWGYCNLRSEYLFYFVHCTLPVVLPLSILNNTIKTRVLFGLLIVVFLNLLFRDVRIIVITYLVCLIVLSNRIVAFALLSKKYRQILPIYIAILFLIVLTNLTYLLGYFKMDWAHSQLINYFSGTIKFVYLSTIILGHVYLRRFIFN
jgi:hypothetical protein